MFQYPYSPRIDNAKCVICGRYSSLIFKAMGTCGDCIRKKPEESLAVVRRVHAESRSRFGLINFTQYLFIKSMYDFPGI